MLMPTIIKGTFQGVKTRKVTTLKKGDVIAYNEDTHCVHLFRPQGDEQYAIKDHFSENAKEMYCPKISNDPHLFMQIVSLVAAVTGLSAESTTNFSDFKWAYYFK